MTDSVEPLERTALAMGWVQATSADDRQRAERLVAEGRLERHPNFGRAAHIYRVPIRAPEPAPAPPLLVLIAALHDLLAACRDMEPARYEVAEDAYRHAWANLDPADRDALEPMRLALNPDNW